MGDPEVGYWAIPDWRSLRICGLTAFTWGIIRILIMVSFYRSLPATPHQFSSAQLAERIYTCCGRDAKNRIPNSIPEALGITPLLHCAVLSLTHASLDTQGSHMNTHNHKASNKHLLCFLYVVRSGSVTVSWRPGARPGTPDSGPWLQGVVMSTKMRCDFCDWPALGVQLFSALNLRTFGTYLQVAAVCCGFPWTSTHCVESRLRCQLCCTAVLLLCLEFAATVL